MDDQEGLFPVSDAASQDQQEEAIAVLKVRTFDLALKDDQLLTQHGIFKDELAFRPSEVAERIADQGGLCGGTRPATEELIQE